MHPTPTIVDAPADNDAVHPLAYVEVRGVAVQAGKDATHAGHRCVDAVVPTCAHAAAEGGGLGFAIGTERPPGVWATPTQQIQWVNNTEDRTNTDPGFMILPAQHAICPTIRSTAGSVTRDRARPSSFASYWKSGRLPNTWPSPHRRSAIENPLCRVSFSGHPQTPHRPTIPTTHTQVCLRKFGEKMGGGSLSVPDPPPEHICL